METATPAASAAPAAPASAPATSGAPTTSGDTQRPTTFAQAFAQNPVDAPASPASTSAPSDQPASATVTPEAAATPTPGPLPFEAHKRILDNAYKERDTFKGQLESLRQQFDSPEGQRLRSWGEAFAQNPEGWFGQTVAELAAARPDLVPALRSQAAKLLGSRQATSAEPASMEPDIPVYNEQGQMVAQTFSADRVKAIVTHAVNEALQREVSPIKQDFQQRKAADEQRQIHQQATQTAAQQFEAAKQWDGFLVDKAKGTVDPDLVKAFGEHPEWSLERTYIEVVGPKLAKQREAKVLDDLQTKAAQATGVNPASAAITSTRRPTSFNDPALRWS